MKAKEIRHLYWRAGFGIQPIELSTIASKNKKQVVKELFQASRKTTPLKIDMPELQEYVDNMASYSRKNFKEFNEISKKKIFEQNTAWVDRLIAPPELLRERMTLFWANHFVCRDNNALLIQQYNNTLRKHALGNFGDFVKAISKEASMIKYLNNKQNVKARPNENFGRELLELFTLGVGNYSEGDIKAAARAYTGWNHKFDGSFFLKKKVHDFGDKTFMGSTGDFDGDAIVDLILKEKQCARFVCTKIYAHFVNENIDQKRVEELTMLFYKDYNIENLMQYIFMSNWFYDEENMGTKIKSPIELLVGIQNVVPVAFQNEKATYYFQNIMGQVLLRPPNVAGWPGGKNWIDSNTMMVRLKLPSVLLNNAVIALEEKGEFEESYEMYYQRVKKRKKYLNTVPNWEAFDANFESFSTQELQSSLLVCELSSGANDLLKQLKVGSKRDYCIQLMSIPEYQMC